MNIDGIAKLDKKTKNLVKRLNPDNIAIIDQEDLDRVTAESLLDTGVQIVINSAQYITGRYPNTGPLLLASAKVKLIEDAGKEIFKLVNEGDRVMVKDSSIYKDAKMVAKGNILTLEAIEDKMTAARKNLSGELQDFAVNTLSYVQAEKGFILDKPSLPEIKTQIKDRPVLIVVRGYDYKQDLRMLRSYIRDIKPVIIGVDGGADALVEEGYKPDIIIGDMDSAGDKALRLARELVVHAYTNGVAPGLKRIEKLGLNALVFKVEGTSEDVAMVLAYELGAEIIVLVGSHANLIEFLDKGRKGMASTFLARLKVGDRLVDAKGVSKLYRSKPKVGYLITIILAAFITTIIIIMSSPQVRNFVSLVVSRIRLSLGM
ncbi:MAG: hypothetical protein C4562_01395 [Actinobacteria bacterium]|nr:MAG: hypothetical protein C4562_01395 [Actinomycetota bacterium]